MEMVLFMVLIAASSVFVMMSLGYSNKNGDVRTLEYLSVKINDEMNYEDAKRLLYHIKRDINNLELKEKYKPIQIKNRAYGNGEQSQKEVEKRLKKELKTIPVNLEKLYERKEALEKIIKDYENIISNKAGDARSVFNPNPVPA